MRDPSTTNKHPQVRLQLAEIQFTANRSPDHGHAKGSIRVSLLRECLPNSHGLHDMLVWLLSRKDLPARLLELL